MNQTGTVPTNDPSTTDSSEMYPRTTEQSPMDKSTASPCLGKEKCEASNARNDDLGLPAHDTANIEKKDVRADQRSVSLPSNNLSIQRNHAGRMGTALNRKYRRQEARLNCMVAMVLGYFTLAWFALFSIIFADLICEAQCNINRYIR